MTDDQLDARGFWRWFCSIEQDLAADLENPTLVGDLDRRVLALGADLTWEIGPGSAKPFAVTISPAGNPDNLERTRSIVSLAPELPNWEFHETKQPKSWTLRFQVADPLGDMIAIDANDWSYVLHEFPDEMFDLMVRAPGLAHLDQDTRDAAAYIAAEGMLGELAMLEHIACVECVPELEDDLAARATDFRHLRDHLASLRSGRVGS